MFTRLQEVRRSQDEKTLRAIHSRTCAAVERLKACEADLIRCLQEVDQFLVHRFIGYNSLFQYAVHALKLSEAQSYAYITVARKAQELPQLQEALVSGELTVSKAVRITSVINEQTQAKWIGLALELPKRDLEREVARENPRAARPEQARFLDAHTLQLQTPISEVGYKKLERARELMASGDGEWLSLETAIEQLAEFYLERKDPVRKAERAIMWASRTLEGQRNPSSRLKPSAPLHQMATPNEKVQPSQTAQSFAPERTSMEAAAGKTDEPMLQEWGATPNALPANSARAMPHAETANPAAADDSSVASNSAQARSEEQNLKPVSPVSSEVVSISSAAIPAAVAHQVHLRDLGRCQARLPDGSPCGTSLWEELHHLRPRSRGGQNVADNLTTLCRAHHQAWHV
ncbi:MAG: HNH endonuclease [Bdellovibrionaceae bacterium]|nr:HNH endonuclease [Pseudobdellovibrionaceae bacterium]